VSDSPFGGATSLTKSGFGNWVLTGSNTYSGTTTIAAGVLVLQGNGSLGSGNIIDDGALVFRGGGTFTVTGTISGSGDVIKVENGTVILPGNNTYARVTEIYGGTMIINGNNASASTTVFGGTLGGIGTLAGPVTLNAGTTLVPGVSAASIGTLTINSSLTVGGNLAVEVNKSLSPSNDFVVVSSTLTNGGTGTLTVTNLGPALVVGDKFTLFSQPVQNGAALTVKGEGVNWANNLAVDGSISVIAPPTLNFTQTGNSIQFSWTGSFRLQAQTNSASVGLGTNWVNYPSGFTSPITVPINKTNGTVFFRLISQ
jgi:fibronectin-binding autotransporter adhesin